MYSGSFRLRTVCGTWGVVLGERPWGPPTGPGPDAVPSPGARPLPAYLGELITQTGDRWRGLSGGGYSRDGGGRGQMSRTSGDTGTFRDF